MEEELNHNKAERSTLKKVFWEWHLITLLMQVFILLLFMQ